MGKEVKLFTFYLFLQLWNQRKLQFSSLKDPWFSSKQKWKSWCMKRKSIMNGLGARVETKAQAPYTQGLPICKRARPAGAAQRHTLIHALSQAHTLAPFFSQWQTSCRWLILEHVAPELGKMSKSISLTPNLLPPLPHKPHSKVIQRATEVHFCICFYFLFLEGEGTLLWFSDMYYRHSAANT